MNVNNLDIDTYKNIQNIIELLNNGIIRIAEKKNNKWITHSWIKKAILLYMYFTKNKLMKNGNNNFYDKIDLKY
ncbi:MAG: 2,3,4,5-tetrahydropyridine-2,6-dicarboxylate N-succinyltransferase, partial [Candidatus Blochmannia sp. A2]|nr:2,3,4,5-tetrahydropyridine-2,6-dicarboxylate N-succinyltransferase [Candidatus Blochmannia sp. A2]